MEDTITVWRFTDKQIEALREVIKDEMWGMAKIDSIYFTDGGTLRIVYFRVDDPFEFITKRSVTRKIKDISNKDK